MAKIAVAMSGGVDSSTAAFILKKQGHDIIGVTMKLWVHGDEKNRPGGCPSTSLKAVNLSNCPSTSLKAVSLSNCCSLKDVHDAKRVCDNLGIRHYVFNMEKDFKKLVVDSFVKEYLSARTPNPCIVCNEKIKFDLLLKKISSLGFDYLATGHYARVERSRVNGEIIYQLKKGKDNDKDQSYFLYRLGQGELSRLKFPLGNMTKKEVRRVALKNRIPVAQKADSQEICFVRDNYANFIKSYVRKPSRALEPGKVVDKKGKLLGMHKGLIYYTIGQRSGLGISAEKPVYIIKIDAASNKIIVGDKKDVYSKKMVVRDILWTSGASPKFPLKCKVKIRRQHPADHALITAVKSGLRVQFGKPQHAITPGQSAVFYAGNNVLGGGIIQ